MASSIQSPVLIDANSIHAVLSHKSLIDHFHSSLPTVSPSVQTPIRQSYDLSPASSLLLMPSWSSHPSLPYIGVKLVTYFPENSAQNLPGVQATYVLFSSVTGQALASIDGTVLTLYRTASVSGLASKFLARNDSEIMVMVGAGSLAPHLIRAHLAARPSLKRVIIWNRTFDKAKSLAETLKGDKTLVGVNFEANACLAEVVPLADIVSCATNSREALVMGEWLKAGAHLDLVGSFKPEMKECDDVALTRGRVFVDNSAALEEAGELVGGLERGVVKKEEIGVGLEDMANKVGRRKDDEITVFKSVGSGLVDILSAQLVYDLCVRRN